MLANSARAVSVLLGGTGRAQVPAVRTIGSSALLLKPVLPAHARSSSPSEQRAGVA